MYYPLWGGTSSCGVFRRELMKRLIFFVVALILLVSSARAQRPNYPQNPYCTGLQNPTNFAVAGGQSNALWYGYSGSKTSNSSTCSVSGSTWTNTVIQASNLESYTNTNGCNYCAYEGFFEGSPDARTASTDIDGQTDWQRQFVIKGPGTDIETHGRLSYLPHDTAFHTSIRLGNYCGNHGAEKLYYEFNVNPNNSLVSLWYALSLHHGAHSAADNPDLVITVEKQLPNGTWTPAMGDTLCHIIPSPDYNNQTDLTGTPFYVGSTGMQQGASYGCNIYLPWRKVLINLNQLQYQRVRIMVAFGDCSMAAHFGLCYFAGKCEPLQLNSNSYVTGNGSHVTTINAPEDAESYAWYRSKTGILSGSSLADMNNYVLIPGATESVLPISEEYYINTTTGDTMAQNTFLCQLTTSMNPTKPITTSLFTDVNLPSNSDSTGSDPLPPFYVINGNEMSTGTSAESLVNNLLKSGGITVSNVHFNGDSLISCNSIGKFVFNNIASPIGMQSGLILSSGNVSEAYDPSVPFYTNCTSYSDTVLSAYTSYNLTNIATLEFDFVPQGDSIELKYIFASMEYPQYVTWPTPDPMTIFLSGPKPAIAGGGLYSNENLATLPSTSTAVGIPTINANVNSQYYVDNSSHPYLRYGGYTTPMTAKADVIPFETYHLSISIANGTDPVLSSAIFIDSGSFKDYIIPCDTVFVYDTVYITEYDTVTVTNFDTVFITDSMWVEHDYYDIVVTSENSSMGLAAGNGHFPEGTAVEIAAIPIEGNGFVSWNDGDINNPRTIVLTSDTAFYAIFSTIDVKEVIGAATWSLRGERGELIVEGAEGQRIRIYDLWGRLLATIENASNVERYQVPATGGYVVQVGNTPAKKINVKY